jgi:hypothetical protein
MKTLPSGMRTAAMSARAILFASLVLALAACAPRGLVRQGVDVDKADAPTKLMVATPDFLIQEVDVGRTAERVVTWEQQAGKAFEAAVVKLSDKEKKFEVVSPGLLTEEELETVNQHRALFASMAPQLLQIKEGAVDVWADEKKKFAYSVGPGMRFLKEQYGVDAIVLVVGKDTVRSTARIVLDVVNSVLPGATSGEAGFAYLVSAVVETRSGDILLFDYDAAKRKQLSNQKDVAAMADEVMTDYRRMLKKGAWF